METTKSSFASSFSEVNLKIIFKKILKRKVFFIVSVFLCCLAAFLYLKTTVNVYEVSTTILIDPEGKKSLLSPSDYIEGGVGLLEEEKNLFNEKSILKSFSLLNEAINDLDFDVSYYNGTWYRKKEYYHNFPFDVTFKDSTAQMYGVFFKVEPVSDEKFKLIVETKKFDVLNPETGAIREIEKDFEFSNTYAFGEEINHKYFNFTLNKTNIDFDEFDDEDFWFKFHTVDGLTKTYLGRLQVDQTDLQGSILRLMTSGKVIEKEKLFLEKLTEKYIESKIEERERIAKKKEDFLIQQLSSMSDSLSRAESRLEYFKKVANLSNIQQSSTYALEQLQNLESNKTQLESNIKYYKTILQYISDSTGIEKIIAPSVVGIDDPLLNENLLELKRLNSEKIRNRFFKGRQSYDLEIMEQQIKNTTIVLQENLKNLIQATEISLADKSQQLSSLELTINQLPTNERMLLNLERKTSRFENFYNYLSQELAKTGIAKAESILDTKVLDAPRMKGSGAVAPQKKMIMALSFMLGLFIPFLWIMFFDPYDGEITNAEQIEAFSSVPIIANIAHKSSRTPKFDTSSDNWQVDETFRDMIANLQVSIVDTAAKVIGVTSTVPKEGKTFCAIELAKSLAAQGKKNALT
jgi:capsular polysaccharide biosynthesis protein